MIDTVAKLREAFVAADGNSSGLLILPGRDIELNPEGVAALADDRAARKRLVSEVEAARNKLSGLRRAVLAAAFSGMLTSRHTDDEVIEELAEAMA